MDLTNRAMTAFVCCVAGLLVGAFGLAAIQRGFDRRPIPAVPDISEGEIKTRRGMSPQAADAIALRTMELIKARERIDALESDASQRSLAILEADRRATQLEEEVARLRDERNEALDLLISLLEVPQERVAAAPPADTEVPASEVTSRPEPAPGLAELERLLEIEMLRGELDELQAAMTAMQAQQALAITGLRDDWERAENAALRAVTGAGTAAVPVLINQLENDQPTVRRWAARALGALGPLAADAVPSLRLALADREESVRREVEAALRAIRE